MQRVENKLVTMRTEELIKKEKLLIPLWKEEKEGGIGLGGLHPCTRTQVKSAG